MEVRVSMERDLYPGEERIHRNHSTRCMGRKGGHRGNIISQERHDGNKKTENDECRKRRDKTVV